MKKYFIVSVLLVLLIIGNIYSQSGWFWQNPLPQGNLLYNVSFVNDQIIYISGAGGTLLKSTDSGNNLISIQTGLSEDLGVSFINELTGFSGAWDGGILRTTTGGTSWEYFQIRSGYSCGIQFVSGTAVFALAIAYVGNYISSYIYKSTDLGATWNLSLKADTNTYINSFHFPNINTGYAVGGKRPYQRTKIYKTTNNGQSWDSIASNIYAEFNSVFFTDVNTGYVLTKIHRENILKTTNGCISWDTVFNLNSQYYGLKFFDQNSGYANRGQGIVITTNAGTNWNYVDCYNRIYLKNINDGLGFAAYNSNFLLKTSNSGMNWTYITQGFNYDLLGVTFINENTGFCAAYNRVYKTTNAGNNWIEYFLNLNDWPVVENIMFVNNNTGYAGIDGGKIAKTTNCGLNWQVYKTASYDHSHGMSFPSADTGYIFTKMGYHLKTINGGINWINLGQVGADSYGHSCFINNTTGFAGGSNYGPNDSGFISITRNGGLTWNSVLIDSVSGFYDVGKADNNTWFAVGEYVFYNYQPGCIYRSTNAGYNWSKTIFPRAIISIYFPTALTGYASSYGGVIYKTTNRGDTWFPTRCINASSSTGIYFINDLTGWAVGRSGQIIKTTTGGGELIGIQPITNEIPKTFMLYQNYPNPFNPNTVISFQLPKGMAVNSFTKLTVYDVIGREVATLVNEQLQAGTYEVEWNAKNFSSGVYFYRLEIDDGSAQLIITKKMVLLK